MDVILYSWNHFIRIILLLILIIGIIHTRQRRLFILNLIGVFKFYRWRRFCVAIILFKVGRIFHERVTGPYWHGIGELGIFQSYLFLGFFVTDHIGLVVFHFCRPHINNSVFIRVQVVRCLSRYRIYFHHKELPWPVFHWCSIFQYVHIAVVGFEVVLALMIILLEKLNSKLPVLLKVDVHFVNVKLFYQ